jgi:hypothetical protein
MLGGIGTHEQKPDSLFMSAHFARMLGLAHRISEERHSAGASDVNNRTWLL